MFLHVRIFSGRFKCFLSLSIQSTRFFTVFTVIVGWLGSRVVSVLDSGAEGPGSNRSRDAVGLQS